MKIYQGVTIGALSTRKGQALAGTKRHPTIEDNVIIYANATILGGDTVVWKNATVAGNTFVTESIPADAKVFGLTAGLPVTLEGLVGAHGQVWGLESFGFSAPYKVLDEKLGFTAENVYKQVKAMI